MHRKHGSVKKPEGILPKTEQGEKRAGPRLKQREKRKDDKTEGIRGGIEAIMKYRDPKFRYKLLKWHKEGMLRTDDEIKSIDLLMTETADMIIADELKRINAGEYDDLGLDEDETNPDAHVYERLHHLRMLGISIFNNCYGDYVSEDIAEQFNETRTSLETLLLEAEEAREKRLLCEVKKDHLSALVGTRRYPNKLVGGVIGWFCQDFSLESRKWWIRGICVLLTPALWFVVIPVYLLLWVYVACKSNEDIRRQKLIVRDAKHAANC